MLLFSVGNGVGVLKNVIFFACNCSDGRGLSSNMETGDIIYAACQDVCFV